MSILKLLSTTCCIFFLITNVCQALPLSDEERVPQDQFKSFKITELENWLILEQSQASVNSQFDPGIYVFKNSDKGAQQIYYYPLTEPRYFRQYGFLSFIEGFVDKDLCIYCSQEQLSKVGSRYKIPIRIHLPSFRIEVMVDEATKRKVLKLLKQRVSDLSYAYAAHPHHLSYLLASQRQLTNLLVTSPAFDDVNIDE